MKTSTKGLLEIAQYEGCCTKPYFDSVGVLTIGIGATKTEFPDIDSWDKNKEMTLQECCNLFKQHIVRYEATVNGCLLRSVEQWQFDALVSLCYNIGQTGLMNSTLIKYINAGVALSDIAMAFMMWNRPKEIIGRRTKEKNLYLNGTYTNDGKILVTTTDGKGHELMRSAKSIDISSYL
jgi:lysozyme